VTAAVGRFDGSVTVLAPYEKNAEGKLCPRYRDLFPEAAAAGAGALLRRSRASSARSRA
jgi:molybdopterin/thiamine biosynthesis adenylyltransferase